MRHKDPLFFHCSNSPQCDPGVATGEVKKKGATYVGVKFVLLVVESPGMSVTLDVFKTTVTQSNALILHIEEKSNVKLTKNDGKMMSKYGL